MREGVKEAKAPGGGGPGFSQEVDVQLLARPSQRLDAVGAL